MVGVPWIYFIDTSRRTDYLLCVGAAVVTGSLALALAAAGAWTVAAALMVLTLALVATAEYARLLWKWEQLKAGSAAGRAVKVRPLQ